MTLHALYTLGYARWTVPALASELTRLGALLADVRISPRSRRPEWNGPTLHAALGAAYARIPDLGNPNAFNGGPLALHRPERGLSRLLDLLQHQPVVVMCQCADWRTCHRRLIAEALDERVPGLSVTHLEPPPPAPGEGDILTLTLHQPWASLMVVEALHPGIGKRHETRFWPTRYRGWLALHAAQGGLPKGDLTALCAAPTFRNTLARIGVTGPEALPRGAVVALGRLVDCLPAEEAEPNLESPNRAFGDFAPGRWAWAFDPLLALLTPIPARGAQQLWRWTPPPEVWAMIAAQERGA